MLYRALTPFGYSLRFILNSGCIVLDAIQIQNMRYLYICYAKNLILEVWGKTFPGIAHNQQDILDC